MLSFVRVKGAFLSFWGRENPPRERLGAGMRLSFPMILVFSAGSRGHWKQTKSAVALWTPSPPMLQWERRGVGERMTDQHAGIVCSCHRPNRAEGSREGTSSRFILPCRVQGQRPCWGQGAKPLGSLFSVNPNKRRENQKNMWKCGANYDIIGMLAPEKGEKRGIKGGN